MINGGYYDEKVDVFSFGIILLEVLTVLNQYFFWHNYDDQHITGRKDQHRDQNNNFLLFMLLFLYQVIGKVMADPDCLPRLPTFAVDEAQFTEKFAQNCPKDFLTLAFNCCTYEQDDR